MDKQQRKWERTLGQLSLLASWASVGLLCLGAASVIFLWIYAACVGLYPNPRAISRTTLWAGNAFLSDAVYDLVWLPMSALSAAVFSALLKPNVRALIVIPLGVVCFFLVAAHMGLVDD